MAGSAVFKRVFAFGVTGIHSACNGNTMIAQHDLRSDLVPRQKIFCGVHSRNPTFES